MLLFFFFFFFSSRRRHTRSLCDWSSDVCSSDLVSDEPSGTSAGAADRLWHHQVHLHLGDDIPDFTGHAPSPHAVAAMKPRSEERRVGKECRPRRATDNEKKKMNQRSVSKTAHNT